MTASGSASSSTTTTTTRSMRKQPSRSSTQTKTHSGSSVPTVMTAAPSTEVAEAPTGDPTSTEVNYNRTEGGLALVQRRQRSRTVHRRALHHPDDQQHQSHATRTSPSPTTEDAYGLVEANLFCEDESDGIGGFLSNEWGSDDISFNVYSRRQTRRSRRQRGRPRVRRRQPTHPHQVDGQDDPLRRSSRVRASRGR